jgi:hypothetical protein
MPETVIAWGLFTFFAGGALGGWIVLFAIAPEVFHKFWPKRKR